MIEVLALASSIFAHGMWDCEYSFDYPNDNVRETFFSRVVHRPDNSYTSTGYLKYSKINNGDLLSKAMIDEQGRVEVKGKIFSNYPESVEVNLEIDHTGLLTKEYLGKVKDNLMRVGHGLEVVIQDNEAMEVVHKSSGTKTSCKATTE
jgi:hypothetical protein